MFNKLSFVELANFIGSFAILENHYEKETVQAAITEMSTKLDGEITQTKITLDITAEDLAAMDMNMNPVLIPPGEIVRVFDEKMDVDIQAVAGPGSADGQLELLPSEPEKQEDPEGGRKRQFTHRIVKYRKKNGENERIINDWCQKYFGDMTPEMAMLWLYHKKGYTQTKIANMIGGVNQRAVGFFIEKIPEAKKRKAAEKWGIQS